MLQLYNSDKHAISYTTDQYENIIKILGVHDTDRIVSISNLSYHELHKYARSTQSRGLQYFILPNSEDAEGEMSITRKSMSYTNKEVKESIQEIINQLEVADRVLSHNDLSKLSNDFEAIIDSGKIVQVKRDYKGTDYFKISTGMMFSILFMSVASVMNMLMFKHYLSGYRGSAGVSDFKKVFIN